MKGKLIVIEGVDGSGKTTQFNLLREKLESEGKRVETIHFPQHGNKFFGVMVDEYLTGKFGEAGKVDPHLASVLYACDRWEAKDTINAWLEDGAVVLLDRYMTSNKGHQLGKISDDKEKAEYLKWLDEMEYETFKIPVPGVVFYLDVPTDIVLGFIEQRDSTGKEYSDGGKDQHENVEHLNGAREGYQFTVDRYNYWQRIECAPDAQMRSIEDIHEEIYKIVKKIV